jgi:1-deoxy-D-xylulose-5-phosphate reductoisomerase
MSAGHQLEQLVRRARSCEPEAVCIADEAQAESVRRQLPGVRVLSGPEGLAQLAALDEADVVVNGLVGAVGLLPTLEALKAGKTVAMANKEPLVMAGALVQRAAVEGGGALLPVDSEPNAMWQCLRGESTDEVKRLFLTASGGAFRGWTRKQMTTVTPAQALEHPTWRMGSKITVDCATLMNKGFEVIEASLLFDVGIDQVKVVVHRESVVHSMVEFVDGAILAHLGKTDMSLPIQYALTYPERKPASMDALDLVALGALHFEEPDLETFPGLELCYEAGRRGGTAPAVLNAADEVAVEGFLRGEIGFLDIHEVNRRTLERHHPRPAHSLAEVLAADVEGRRLAREHMTVAGA